MAFPCERQHIKMIKEHKLKELQQKLASAGFSQTIQQQTMRVFVMIKFLRDEIAAFLHSCLPDPFR